MTPREHARRWHETAKRRGIPELRGQRSGKGTKPFTGKAIERVMYAYRSFAAGGDIHPSQQALAERAGVHKRTVELVQDWLRETGWLVVTGSAVVGVRGATVRLVIPDADAVFEPPPRQQDPQPRRIEAGVGMQLNGEVQSEAYWLRKAENIANERVPVHRAGSLDPNDYVLVPVAPSARTFYLDMAERCRLYGSTSVLPAAIAEGRCRQLPNKLSIT